MPKWHVIIEMAELSLLKFKTYTYGWHYTIGKYKQYYISKLKVEGFAWITSIMFFYIHITAAGLRIMVNITF